MNNEWSTPQYLFDELNQEFNFNMDVCADYWNHKCKNFFDIEANGLNQSWVGTCWMNPPYDKTIKYWIQKAYEESLKGVTTVALIPSRTETIWFHDYCLKSNVEIRFIKRRVNFTDINGKSGRPRFGSAIVIFKGK
jgi:phage N-6-adenine-methyltransferase